MKEMVCVCTECCLLLGSNSGNTDSIFTGSFEWAFKILVTSSFSGFRRQHRNLPIA